MRRTVAAVLLVLACMSVPFRVDADGSWIDAGGNWNRPDSPLPTAPPPLPGQSNRDTCEDVGREADTPEDAAVQAAGWLLSRTFVTNGGVTVVEASVDYDAHCRPTESQAFVFVDGQYPGTLAPRPMHPEADGRLVQVGVANTGEITAVFSRYSEDDSACCPSAISTVRYGLDRSAGAPVVGPVSALTSSTHPGQGAPSEIDRRPRVRLTIPPDQVKADRTFEIEVEASDVDGLARIWWYAEGTGDEVLNQGRETVCNGVFVCRASWQASAATAGNVTIFARAVDIDGRESDIAQASLQVVGDAPRLELIVSDERVDTGTPFSVTLRATDGDGLDKIWWWSPDSSDASLRRIREQKCDGATSCERTWDIVPSTVGAFTIQAQVRDTRSNQSEILSAPVRIFNTDPVVTLTVKDTKIDRGSRAHFTVDATDVDGLDWIRVSVLGPDGAELFTETTDCRKRERCRQAYEPRPDVTGSIRIRAKARDIRGKEVEWTEESLRVR